MARYAERTEVSSARSRDEIETTLRRYAATQFVYGWDEGQNEAAIEFVIRERRIRFRLPMPDRNDRRFTHTAARNYRREPEAQAKEWEQAVRASWRALALVIKAKLEAVAAGITTVETEFLPYTVLPDGSTVDQWMQPQMAAVYGANAMPQLLPGSDS